MNDNFKTHFISITQNEVVYFQIPDDLFAITNLVLSEFQLVKNPFWLKEDTLDPMKVLFTVILRVYMQSVNQDTVWKVL